MARAVDCAGRGRVEVALVATDVSAVGDVGLLRPKGQCVHRRAVGHEQPQLATHAQLVGGVAALALAVEP